VALVCILVYLAAVVSAAYRVYRSVDGQHRQGERELDELQALLSQNGDNFRSEAFRETIRKTIMDYRVLQGIIVTGSGTEDMPFEREQGALIRQEGGRPRFITRFGYSGLKARQVDIPGLRNVNIYSVINTVNYEYMVYVLKQTLVAILGALIVSFFTMIVTSLARAKTDEDASRAGKPADAAAEGSSLNRAEDTAAFSGTALEEEAPAEPFENGDLDFSGFDAGGKTESGVPSPDAGADKTDDFNLNDFLDEEELAFPGEDLPAMDLPGAGFPGGDLSGGDSADFPDPGQDELSGGELPDQGFSYQVQSETEEEPFSDLETEEGSEFSVAEDAVAEDAVTEDAVAEDAVAEDAVIEDAFASGNANPKGLYSPRSNIGWEAYVQDRLTSEIHRCAASEQDLVVLLMECGEGVNCDGTLYKKLAGEAVNFFNLRDLSFENGERGITVIIPNADLEHGIIKAEEFHSRILKTCAGQIHAKNDFLIGISSRSGRLIEAERLLLEAAKALEKAKIEQSTPIVAFKSDPEKYREFIKKNSAG
jgi:hypothetical protein